MKGLSPMVRDDVTAARQNSSPPAVYEFEGFRLDAENRLLSRDGHGLPLPARAFDTLLLLVQHPGRLVTKDELLRAVWVDSFVEESNLTVAVSTLRKVLGEDPQERRFIQTVSGRGYRFISPVQVRAPELAVPAEPRALPPEPSAPPALNITAETQSGAAEPAIEQPPVLAATLPPSQARRHLQWLVLGGIGMLLLAWAVFAWVHRAGAGNFRIHALAVLPMTGTGMDEESLLGMSDAMIGTLGNDLGNGVAVRPMSSVLKYSVQPEDVQAAGREQGTDAVVTSHALRFGNQATLEVRLLRTGDGHALWSHSYHDTADHLADLQAHAEHDLADRLRGLVAVSPAHPTQPPRTAAVSPEAYQAYLRGRYFWNRRTEDGLRKSIDLFRQSIQAQPDYAPAYAGLADAYALLASFSVESGRTATPDARAAALSAIQLDPTLAEPHASLGMIYFFTDWNGPAAEQEFERAIALNPNYATAHHWYALDLAAMGRFPQALYEIRKAQSLDPLSLIIDTNVGWIEYLNRQNDAAIAEFRKCLELDPSFVRARTRLGTAELQAGNTAAAVADLQAAAKASGDPYVSGLLGEALARNGQRDAAEQVLRDLQARKATKYVPPFALALVYLGLDRKAEAMEALQAAAGDRSTSMVYAKIDPSLDPLRSDPGFAAIVAKMRF